MSSLYKLIIEDFTAKKRYLVHERPHIGDEELLRRTLLHVAELEFGELFEAVFRQLQHALCDHFLQ